MHIVGGHVEDMRLDLRLENGVWLKNCGKMQPLLSWWQRIQFLVEDNGGLGAGAGVGAGA